MAVHLPAMAGELITDGAPVPGVVPRQRARWRVPTEQELDCQDTAGRWVRLHIVVGDRGRVGLRIAGQSSVLWLVGGGNAFAAGIRTALADTLSRPVVACEDGHGQRCEIRLGVTPSRRIGVLIPGRRSALWLADALAVAWAARRAHSEATQRTARGTR